MRPEEIRELRAARESLCRCRGELAHQIATVHYGIIETGEKLAKVLMTIEAIDRALNEAGHPYMSEQLQVEAEPRSTPQPKR